MKARINILFLNFRLRFRTTVFFPLIEAFDIFVTQYKRFTGYPDISRPDNVTVLTGKLIDREIT